MISRATPGTVTGRPAWVEIDLAAISRNLEHLRQSVAPSSLLAIVKADAYGHGAVEVSRSLVEAHVDWLGVALVEEGIELRRAGVAAPILVLGPAQREQIPTVVNHDLVPALSSCDQLEHWISVLEELRPGRPLSVHLKLDSGMHRLGIGREDWAGAVSRVENSEVLSLGGILSHLADAEDLESPRNRQQETAFRAAMIETRRLSSNSDFVVHLANSAAALHHPHSHHTMVRSGLTLYGLDPVGRFDETLEPAMAVRGRIVHDFELQAGERVGYRGSWTAARASRIGIVQVGYADGYAWRLGNRAEALVAGRRAPIAGDVSMDMVAVDLTGIPVEPEDTVTLLGTDGSESISATELAERAGMSTYELLCHFGLRLPKIYLRDEERVGATSRFF